MLPQSRPFPTKEKDGEAACTWGFQTPRLAGYCLLIWARNAFGLQVARQEYDVKTAVEALEKEKRIREEVRGNRLLCRNGSKTWQRRSNTCNMVMARKFVNLQTWQWHANTATVCKYCNGMFAGVSVC